MENPLEGFEFEPTMITPVHEIIPTANNPSPLLKPIVVTGAPPDHTEISEEQASGLVKMCNELVDSVPKDSRGVRVTATVGSVIVRNDLNQYEPIASGADITGCVIGVEHVANIDPETGCLDSRHYAVLRLNTAGNPNIKEDVAYVKLADILSIEALSNDTVALEDFDAEFDAEPLDEKGEILPQVESMPSRIIDFCEEVMGIISGQDLMNNSRSQHPSNAQSLSGQVIAASKNMGDKQGELRVDLFEAFFSRGTIYQIGNPEVRIIKGLNFVGTFSSIDVHVGPAGLLDAVIRLDPLAISHERGQQIDTDDSPTEVIVTLQELKAATGRLE